MKREHLLHFFPFLKKEFRRLEISEITSEEVFKELFPNESIDYSKLNAIYHYQNTEPVRDYFPDGIKETTELKCYVKSKDVNSKQKLKRNNEI